MQIFFAKKLSEKIFYLLFSA